MPRDPRAYLQRAEEHRRHGRLKEAIALSLEALGKHPGLDAVRVTLGRAYLEDAQPEEARTTLLEVFGRLPEHHLAGKLLIESQRLLGDLGGAEATCRTLLEHYPRDREIEPLLAEIVRARSSSIAAAAPVAAAPAPASRPTPAAPPVAERETDPEPEYFPEDVAMSPATPARAPVPTVSMTPLAPADPTPVAPAPKVTAAAAPRAAEPTPPAAATAVPAAKPASPASSIAAAAPAKPEVTPVLAPAVPRDALETNTLAELYVRQGLPDRAIDVYRSMLKVEPGNAAAKRRLAELESATAGAGASRAGPSDRAERPGSGSPKSAAPALAPPAPAAASASSEPPIPVESFAPAPARVAAGPERAAIERLERWIASVKRGQDRQGGGAAA